ncbi:MAG TPA: inositol monophosphatase family protein [Actinomycetota bacterium]|nr:inositol monophosphatase family protein [Actinomycetota bacterium]
MPDNQDLLDIARRAAISAGELLLERFEGPAAGVGSKTTPTDLVSDADRESEKLLVELISAARPEDGIVSEEGSREGSTSGLTWVIDPLDGTVNYLFRIPWWAVSIAVEDESGARAGVVLDPTRGDLFAAERGRGATLNGDPIEVSSRDDLSEALIGTGFAYDARARRQQAEIVTRVLPVARDIRRAGSAALDLASLACGRLDGFYEAPMERWDKAAGVLIAREAGAVVTDLPAPHGLSTGVIAANARLHERLSALVLG